MVSHKLFWSFPAGSNLAAWCKPAHILKLHHSSHRIVQGFMAHSVVSGVCAHCVQTGDMGQQRKWGGQDYFYHFLHLPWVQIHFWTTQVACPALYSYEYVKDHLLPGPPPEVIWECPSTGATSLWGSAGGDKREGLLCGGTTAVELRMEPSLFAFCCWLVSFCVHSLSIIFAALLLFFLLFHSLVL